MVSAKLADAWVSVKTPLPTLHLIFHINLIAHFTNSLF